MARKPHKSQILLIALAMAASTACGESSTPTTGGQPQDPTTSATTGQPSDSTTPTSTTIVATTSTTSLDEPTPDNPPQTIGEAFDLLGEMGATAALSAEIVDGRCEIVTGLNNDTPTPLESVAKLYVLAAVGEAADAGELEWDDELVISDDEKSIPPGMFQDLPDGTTVTVRDAANQMMSLSDNTATDLLIDLVGRQTVESAMVDYGNSTPELNRPFLTTLELAALKVGPASGLRTQWIGGDEATRRDILTQISDITRADLPIQDWTEPIDPDLVEWLATPNDLCALAIGLEDLALRVPEIAEVLSESRTTDPLPGMWEATWFKGGAEPGLAATWFVTRSGGRTFVTTGSVVDPAATIDTDQAMQLFAAARDLLSP